MSIVLCSLQYEPWLQHGIYSSQDRRYALRRADRHSGAGLYSFILFKTKAGRYLYAIGGNVEAARRAGVAVNRYRLLAFAMTGFTAGIAGLVYASTLGGISDGIQGGQLVLYGVAAAVIGGTSLYGGRGKMIHALIGGLVIGVIFNGLALIQTSASVEFMADRTRSVGGHRYRRCRSTRSLGGRSLGQRPTSVSYAALTNDDV